MDMRDHSRGEAYWSLWMPIQSGQRLWQWMKPPQTGQWMNFVLSLPGGDTAANGNRLWASVHFIRISWPLMTYM